MSPTHETPGGSGGIARDQVGTGSATTVPAAADIPQQLRRRHMAALRLAPFEDSGRRDPLTVEADVPSPSSCSRGFACLAQPLTVLEAAHHCPCDEATAAVSGVSAR